MDEVIQKGSGRRRKHGRNISGERHDNGELKVVMTSYASYSDAPLAIEQVGVSICLDKEECTVSVDSPRQREWLPGHGLDEEKQI